MVTLGMTYTVLDGYPGQTEGIYFDQELDKRLQEARKYHPLANTTLDLLSCIEICGPNATAYANPQNSINSDQLICLWVMAIFPYT